jgi:hypothetical protein
MLVDMLVNIIFSRELCRRHSFGLNARFKPLEYGVRLVDGRAPSEGLVLVT